MITYNANTVMDYYKYTLENEMDDAIQFGQKICYSDISFKMLTISDLTGSDKVLYQYNINQSLKRQVAPYECIFIFNSDLSVSASAYGSSYEFYNSRLTYQLKEKLRSYWLNNKSPQFNKWILFKDENHSVIMATQEYNNVFICTTIDLDKFDLLKYNNSNNNYMEFGFFNKDKVLSNASVLSDLDISIHDLQKAKSNSFFRNHYLKTVPINGTDIRMFFVFHTNNMWSFTKISVILFIFIAVITCLLLIYFINFLNRIVIYPLDQINAATKHLEQNDSSYFINNSDSNIIEYQNINNALANLIDQKILLDNKKREEAFEKDHARLQYYQLQTSSHFFINCLKSLFHMLENKEYIKMQHMIIAFSNHLRYIFHDNLKFVTLKSELAEVNDYYNIIMIDRGTPIILNTKVDDSLLKYSVPSLIIQTFLENTSKYNKQSDNLLIFDVNITLAELEGIPVMQIQISDNGIGYSQEILNQLNGTENDLFAKEHVGISNLKHRIALIYKSNFQFAFYNKPSGGACALIYIPLLEQLEE
jgi:sensor histidine kinase YesM